jgi:hypothetical protein
MAVVWLLLVSLLRILVKEERSVVKEVDYDARVGYDASGDLRDPTEFAGFRLCSKSTTDPLVLL